MIYSRRYIFIIVIIFCCFNALIAMNEQEKKFEWWSKPESNNILVPGSESIRTINGLSENYNFDNVLFLNKNAFFCEVWGGKMETKSFSIINIKTLDVIKEIPIEKCFSDLIRITPTMFACSYWDGSIRIYDITKKNGEACIKILTCGKISSFATTLVKLYDNIMASNHGEFICIWDITQSEKNACTKIIYKENLEDTKFTFYDTYSCFWTTKQIAEDKIKKIYNKDEDDPKYSTFSIQKLIRISDNKILVVSKNCKNYIINIIDIKNNNSSEQICKISIETIETIESIVFISPKKFIIGGGKGIVAFVDSGKIEILSDENKEYSSYSKFYYSSSLLKLYDGHIVSCTKDGLIMVWQPRGSTYDVIQTCKMNCNIELFEYIEKEHKFIAITSGKSIITIKEAVNKKVNKTFDYNDIYDYENLNYLCKKIDLCNIL